MRLSLHNKNGLGEKYFNEPELWEKTESSVRDALNEAKIKQTFASCFFFASLIVVYTRSVKYSFLFIFMDDNLDFAFFKSISTHATGLNSFPSINTPNL